MKEGFRQSMAWLHTWTGLIVGWVLLFVFVTGTAGYFTYEITRWMEPERPLQQPQPAYDHSVLTNLALNRLQDLAPDAQYWQIQFPHQSLTPRGWQGFSVNWETMPKDGHEHGVRGSADLDPVTGERLQQVQTRETGGGRLLYRMHYSLHYIDYPIAYRIVGVCTMLMLMAMISGVITHKKIFKDFFTFRPGKGQRSWLDAHNVISVLALPFFLMITYSGLVFFAVSYMPAGLTAVYGSDREAVSRYYDDLFGEHSHQQVTIPSASVSGMLAAAEAKWGASQIGSLLVQQDTGEEPRVDIYRVRGDQVRLYDGDILRFHAESGAPLAPEEPKDAILKTNETLRSLHEGLFAGPWLRWLYFFAGVLGCCMIATGLVLWTVKRRKQHAAQWSTNFGLRLVEALNVAAIAGLPAAIAAYFWANRLLPVDMAERAEWEVNCMFLVLGEVLLYTFFRNIRKAWVEVLWFAAAAFTLLPILNLLTTDKHLGFTIPAGDWALAGFDFTMLAFGISFATMAIKVKRRWLKQALPQATLANGNPRLAGGSV